MRPLRIALVLVLVVLVWRTAYFAAWPYVKNLVPHSPICNFARMQDVWLDR